MTHCTEKDFHMTAPSCSRFAWHPGAAMLRGALASFILFGATLAAASNLSAPWRINGNGYPGEVVLQQAVDGSLSGTIYGNPLSGFHAPAERTVVWLRGAPARPDQAFVGNVSPDSGSITGRLFALTVGGGASPARNVFAFSALRASPQAPGHPGVPNATLGPASVAGTLALVANDYAGALVLDQAPDGTLSGTLYGDRLSGHYAQGSATIAFLRFNGAKPMQLYIGSVTPQGISGELYALTVPAGGSAQRMRYGWSAQMPQLAQGQLSPMRPAPFATGIDTPAVAKPLAGFEIPLRPAPVIIPGGYVDPENPENLLGKYRDPDNPRGYIDPQDPANLRGKFSVPVEPINRPPLR